MGRLCWPTKHPATDPDTRRRRGQCVVPVRGGHGAVFAYPDTGFWEGYACRAVPRRSEAKAGVQSCGRIGKKSWYTIF